MTESEKLRDSEHALRIIKDYQKRGFLTAIDDFGAGYAGLNLLAEFQPHLVKLDMALTRDIDRDPVRKAIVGGVIGTCKALGCQIIAEGIESPGGSTRCSRWGSICSRATCLPALLWKRCQTLTRAIAEDASLRGALITLQTQSRCLSVLPRTMHYIVYVSAATKPFSKSNCWNSWPRHAKTSQRLGVTGLLLYKDGDFIQLLEGEASAVKALFSTIQRDSRHACSTVLTEGEAEGRLFSDWSMGFRDLSDPEVQATPGYSQFMNTPLVAESFANDPPRFYDPAVPVQTAVLTPERSRSAVVFSTVRSRTLSWRRRIRERYL